jgi:Domain of unknown function (DUF6457)
MDWLDELAGALGVQAPTAGETAHVLEVSRDVAHRVERRVTPVSTFLLGLAVQRRVGEGVSRETAMEAALADLRSVLPAENG